MPASIAMVLRDQEDRLIVRTAITRAGEACLAFESTAALVRRLALDDVGVAVVDIDRPSIDWRMLLEWRSNWLSPSVHLLAHGAADRALAAQALDSGFDDYVARPVNGPELLARIRGLERRNERRVAGSLNLGGCAIDRVHSCLRSLDEAASLTAREHAMAQLLFEQVGRVVTRQRLAAEVWGSSSELLGHTIEQHVYQLRRKLRRCAGRRLLVYSVYDRGYRLELAALQRRPCATRTRHTTTLPAPRRVSVV